MLYIFNLRLRQQKMQWKNLICNGIFFKNLLLQILLYCGTLYLRRSTTAVFHSKMFFRQIICHLKCCACYSRYVCLGLNSEIDAILRCISNITMSRVKMTHADTICILVFVWCSRVWDFSGNRSGLMYSNKITLHSFANDEQTFCMPFSTASA